MDSFFLVEMGIREPFFHVTYSKDMWSRLRERYLSFAVGEMDSVMFTISMLEILALRKPMINSPAVLTLQVQMPHQFATLSRRGIPVSPFFAGSAFQAKQAGLEDRMPIRLDEIRNWDGFSFPKHMKSDISIWRERQSATHYRCIVLNDRLLDDSLVSSAGSRELRKKRTAEIPSDVQLVALSSAGALGIKFGEVTLQCSEDTGEARLLQMDPSPDFKTLEEKYGLVVAAPLAEYLVTIARHQPDAHGEKRWQPSV
jgi:hypothetical protein